MRLAPSITWKDSAGALPSSVGFCKISVRRPTSLQVGGPHAIQYPWKLHTAVQDDTDGQATARFWLMSYDKRRR